MVPFAASASDHVIIMVGKLTTSIEVTEIITVDVTDPIAVAAKPQNGDKRRAALEAAARSGSSRALAKLSQANAKQDVDAHTGSTVF